LTVLVVGEVAHSVPVPRYVCIRCNDCNESRN